MLRRLSLLTAVSAVLFGSPMLAAAAASPATPATAVTPAIVGGTTALPGSFPWLAFVTIDDGRFQCSGTVVAPDLVLTAGHCVYDASTGRMYAPGKMHVTTGTLDWTSGGQVSGVLRTMAAPGYDPTTGDRDAALIELEHPTTAPPVAFAVGPGNALQAAGTQVVIAGWGLTEAGDQASQPDVLQWAATVVRSSSWCAHQWSEFDAAAELCTIDTPQDTTSFCNGDSGGPVIADEFSGEAGEPTQIGVIDDSRSCATDDPDFSAAVAPLASWVERMIGRAPADGRVRIRAQRRG